MSTGEQVDEQMRPRRASERRSSLQQIEALKVRRASERRASVELSAELVDPARTRRASERRSSFQLVGELMRAGKDAPVHPLREETKTEEAPDPSLTDEERETVKAAVEAMRGDLIKVKHVGPVLSAGGGHKWHSSARAPDGRMFSAPLSARSVL